jgi:hypothetical protein
LSAFGGRPAGFGGGEKLKRKTPAPDAQTGNGGTLLTALKFGRRGKEAKD